jgi:hypothetical protein
MVPAAAGAVVPQCSCHGRRALASHATACHSSWTMTLRHDTLAGTWRSIARDAGLATYSERNLRHLRRDGERGGVGNSRGISCWCCPTRWWLWMLRWCSLQPADVAAATRDHAKRAHHARANVWGEKGLVPLSIESFGRLGKPSLGLLVPWRTSRHPAGGICKSAFVTSALRRLGAALRRGNGRMYGVSSFTFAVAHRVTKDVNSPGCGAHILTVLGSLDVALGRSHSMVKCASQCGM